MLEILGLTGPETFLELFNEVIKFILFDFVLSYLFLNQLEQDFFLHVTKRFLNLQIVENVSLTS